MRKNWKKRQKMAGGGGGGSAGRELDQTPTWAVSMVCGIIVALSFVLEGIFHLVAKVRNNILFTLFILCPSRQWNAS